MKTDKMTPKEAFELFDTLKPVTLNELVEVGVWLGGEIITGHPMDGLLTAVRWYGKKFQQDGGIHPLLYKGINGKVYSVNASEIPFKTIMTFPRWIIKILFFFFAPLIRTKNPCTQYWNVEYRGKITGAMVWDELPIVEIFARIDSNTLLGVTVIKGISDPYFFTLTKPE
ncbi:MAG: DUF4334 domain-containing protein [Chitinispirillales bacterium]|jgi:hypothetical protein|nr:DUF4334 domain-containing protein [Chitinispirillales bacterium]